MNIFPSFWICDYIKRWISKPNKIICYNKKNFLYYQKKSYKKEIKYFGNKNNIYNFRNKNKHFVA